MLITQTLVGYEEEAKANTLAADNLQQVPFFANFTSVDVYDYDEHVNESANAYQAHNDPVDPGCNDGEEAPNHDGDEENDTFFFVCCSG